eukprot:scaffold1362_cov61-Attheya_sp.AAC.2
MASGLLDYVDTKDLPTVYGIWASYLPSRNPISGCARTVTSTVHRSLCRRPSDSSERSQEYQGYPHG